MKTSKIRINEIMDHSKALDLAPFQVITLMCLLAQMSDSWFTFRLLNLGSLFYHNLK